MGRKRIVQIDSRTGEVVEGFVAYVEPKRRNGFGERWMAMAQGAGRIVAENREFLGQEGLALMFLLIDKLDFENHLLINQAELARELGMLRQNVQRSIKRLVELGVLLEGPKVGQNRSYQLNPSIGWKGSAKNHKKALADQRTKRMKAAKITGVIKGGKSDEEK